MSQKRILLVEDHADTARVISQLLRRHGYDVETAMSASAALDLAGQQSFDLIVSDLGLPDRSGLDLMRQLRSEQPQLRGIALSGYGMEEDVRLSREAGFQEHLVKPVDFPRLQAAVETASSGTSLS